MTVRATPLALPLLAIAAIGLALRIAAARGGLWLDEAWSAVFARDVATPAGVFLNIHHDNNHHLNTLWLQIVGFDAAPLAQRALSIACGTGAIVVAGLIGARRGAAAGIATALLFALSPLMATFGSEARGYAAMMLALLVGVLLVDRWLDDRDRAAPTLALVVVALLGMLGQMTMAFGLVALAGWAALRLWREGGLACAVTGSLRLMGPALVAAAGVAVGVLVLLPGVGNFQFGAFEPFSLATWRLGLHNMLEYGFGIGPGAWLPAIAAVLALAGIVFVPPQRRWLYALAIFGLPLAIALVRLGNAGFPRYYLVSAVALLLLAGEAFGRAWDRGAAARLVAVAALCTCLIASGARDLDMIGNRRGDPALAIATMQRLSPEGAGVALDRPRASAVIEAAAASAGYRAAVVPCGRFLFVDRDGDQRFDPAPSRCGRHYHEVARGDPSGISGTHWRLYVMDALP